MKNKIMWALTVFMGLSCIVFFPSIASIIMLIFAVIAVPIAPWQEFLHGVGLRGWLKGVVLCTAFVGAIIVIPPNETADVPAPSEQPSYSGTLPSKKPVETESPEQDRGIPTQSEPAPSEELTPEPTEAQTVNPTPEPTPAPTQTQAPTAAPTVAPTPEPTPEPQPIRGRAPDTIVYVSSRSNTIHSVHDCSGMRNYREMTIYNATQRGYDFCSNCW